MRFTHKPFLFFESNNSVACHRASFPFNFLRVTTIVIATQNSPLKIQTPPILSKVTLYFLRDEYEHQVANQN